MYESSSIAKNSPRSIKISYRTFSLVCLLYLLLPIVVFISFFTKLHVAVLANSLLLITFCFLTKEIYSSSKGKQTISIFLGRLLVFIVIAFLWAFISGIGEFADSTWDHAVRYATLHDLVYYKWPVFFDLSKQSLGEVRGILGGDTVAFAYYFTFYLIPALVGKVFGLFAARVALLIWSTFGLLAVMIAISFFIGKAKLIIPVMCLLFAGFDIIPFTIISKIDNSIGYEGWNQAFNIVGTFCQTMNVYHQCIPGWLIILLLLNTHSNKYVGTISSLIFCYSPWATFGIIPFAAYELFRKDFRNHSKRIYLKSIFHFGNILVPLTLFICFSGFFSSNSNALSTNGFSWQYTSSFFMFLLKYIMCIVFEFGIWVVFLFRHNKSNPLLWIAAAELFVFPLYQISINNDLLMRGSMAPMLVLMILVISQMSNDSKSPINDSNSKKIRKGYADALAIVACSFTPILLILMTIVGTVKLYNHQLPKEDTYYLQIISFGDIRDPNYAQLVDQQFFVHNYSDTFYYKYIGKSDDSQ